jgi:tetratricopeptide (TPR) repeat protein
MQKPMVLRDYQMLAEACQRSGRARTEGHAYYKIGEILSKNKRETLAKSVVYFKRYLNISRRLNDLQGEAKALNCLGIVHYELGGVNNLHIAAEYHKQHAEIADAAGIFIANTNLGLVHSRLGDTHSAVEFHKQALQYAVRAGDKAAESLALSNLGLAGRQQGDISTAKVCVERHLELVTGLQDDVSTCEAYEQLGLLSAQRQDFAAASENFLLALDIAVRNGDQEKAKQIRCQVGFVQGMLRVDDQLKGAAMRMGPA